MQALSSARIIAIANHRDAWLDIAIVHALDRAWMHQGGHVGPDVTLSWNRHAAIYVFQV